MKLNSNELQDPDRRLVELARQACRTAWAPYSGFRVGAAARLDDETTLAASNQESAVFPEGMCAERILLYWLQANYAGWKIVAVALAAERDGKPVEREVYPCGGCAQVFADTEKRQGAPIRILMCGAETCTIVDSAKSLIPYTFELENHV
jgi:cytidine deaminase